MKTLFQYRRAMVAAILLLVCCGAHAARFADPADDVARVYEILDARLALMMDVAAWKWAHREPIVDEARERAVIEGAVAKARELGFDSDPIRRTMGIQVQLARAVEARYFEDWRERGFPAEMALRDLQTDLRPALDAIGNEWLAALYWAQGHFQNAANETASKALRRIATYPGVTAQDLAHLRAALRDVRANTANIDTVGRLHVLRIGTTGDYAPFSYAGADGSLHGADIDLAEALADHLQLQARFVRTSWPTLMTDLEANRFDLALSGISNTPERAAQAGFSTAYHFDGKTPIARCEDRARFGSLSEIDRESVRVIVNAGGTNQQFVREHIERANVIVHADNRTIFDELIAGRADVMITDAIEADLQTRRHKELCRTMSGTLTNAAKAILLPRGSSLAKAVDQWLQTEIARGGVEEKLKRALAAEDVSH